MTVLAAILNHVRTAFLLLKPPLNGSYLNCKNRTKNAEKPSKKAVFLRKMVRVTGFEPAASCSQSRRAINCATPGYEVVGWPGRILPRMRILSRTISRTQKSRVALTGWSDHPAVNLKKDIRNFRNQQLLFNAESKTSHQEKSLLFLRTMYMSGSAKRA